MKQLYPLLILFIFTASFSWGQSAQWIEASTYGPDNYVITTKYTSDSIGNHYLVGTFRDKYIIGDDTLRTQSSFQQNGFIVKIDKNNKVKWAHSLNSTSVSSFNDVAIDKKGNVIVTGFWFGEAVINGTKYSSANYDGVIIQYDSTGKVNWVEIATGAYTQQGQKLYIDDLDNIYWGGSFASSSKIAGINLSSSGFVNSIFLAKLTSTGKAIKVNGYIPSSTAVLGDIAGASDQIYLVGSFFGTFTIGSTTLGNSSGYDMFIVKMDTAFKIDWANDFGSTGQDQITAAHVNSNGILGIGGVFSGSVNFGTTRISGGTNDLFGAIVNSKGAVLFAEEIKATSTFGSQLGITGAFVDAKNGLSVSGFFSSGISWSNKTYNTSGSYDIFIANWTNKGLYSWILTAGSNNTDQAYGLYFNDDGSFSTGGTHMDKAKFGKTTLSSSAKAIFTARCYPPIAAPKFKKYQTQYVYVDSTLTTNIALKLDFPPKYDIIKAPAKNFSFDQSTEQISFTPDNSQLGIDTIQIAATNPGGTDTLLIIVETITKPNITLLTPSSTCLGQSQALNFSSPNSGPLWVSWKINDTIEITDPTALYTFKDTGIYKIQLNIENLFYDKDSAFTSIHVNSVPKAQFLFEDACKSDTLKLIDNSTINSGFINAYTWLFDDSLQASTQNYQLHFDELDTFKVSLIALSNKNCADTLSKTIQITNNPTAKFVAFSACQGEDALLFDQSTTQGDTIKNYHWDFGDGNSLSTNSSGASHAFTLSGKFNVKLTVTTSNGCSNSYNSNITVNPKPIAQFDINDICLGEKIDLINKSTTPVGTLQNYRWIMGDGKAYTQKNTKHTYTKSGQYNINLIVSSSIGCIDTALQTINVYNAPIADFDLSDSCLQSNTSLYFTQSQSTKDTITTYKWWIDGQQEGGNQATLQHSFATHSKEYLVKLYLETETGCKDSIEKNINLKEVIPAVFGVDATCIGSSSKLQQNFNTAELDSLHWIGWGVTMSEINTNEWMVHFDSSTKHQLFIRTFAKNGCQDSSYEVLSAKELPIVNFSYTKQDNKGKYQFEALDNSLNKYEWFFGDGNNSTGQNVEYTYTNDGNYKATLIGTGSNGCIDSSSQNVNVEIEIISVNEHKLLGISVFPNPASSHFTIQLPSSWEHAEQTEWTIYNMQGKAVLKGHLSDLNNNIDISQLANATYTLTIVQKNSTANYQLIKH